MTISGEKILIVDDEPTARIILRKTLDKGGYRVIEASNGEDAVELARSLRPSVALIDAFMPGMDGFDVCDALKGHNLTSDIQVVMVTASQDIGDIERAFEAGALDYITKPFNPHELLIRTRNASILYSSQQEQKRWQENVTRELYLAERLQKRLLANVPMMEPDYALNSAYVPSGGISGDVFDRFVMHDGRIFMYMADVCGHGVAASLVSSLIKVMVGDAVESRVFDTLSEICNGIDVKFRKLLEGDSIYATAFFAIYDPQRKSLLGLSCGHPSPIIVHSDGGVDMPFEERGGLPIGFAIGEKYIYSSEDQVVCELMHGDSVYMYTDGLFEAKAKEGGDECGIERLAQIVACVAEENAFSYRSAELLAERVQSEGYDISEDDCSAMVLHCATPQYVLADLEIDPDYQAISEMGVDLEARLRKRAWSEEAAWKVRLLLIEYCNNVVQHGLAGSAEALHLRICLSGDECIVRVVDGGMRIDFQMILHGASMPDGMAVSGRGIPIIKDIADHVAYYRDHGKNHAYFTISGNSASDGGDS